MSEAIQTRAAVQRDVGWLRAAKWARWLAWASLGWMTIEGAVGLVAGFAAGSIALVGWALSSGVEGLASVIVGRRWQLLRASEGAFVTSDAPVGLWDRPERAKWFGG